MGNTAKTQEKDRRAKVEAMRRQQQAAERRKTLLFIVVAVVVGLGLIAAAAVPAIIKSRNDPMKKALSSFGVAASAAGCDAATSEAAVGGQDHRPAGTKVKYATVPPSSGPHVDTPAPSSRHFYTAEDRPAVETLVHNLEHGYTILWYDTSVAKDATQLDALRGISERVPADASGSKFIVTAWDDTYGKFPTSKHVALSHWGAKQGHRQLCGKVSGEVVKSFMTSYPATDAPEAGAA